MVGKGQLAIIHKVLPGSEPSGKHAIYVNVKTTPDRKDDFDLLDQLLERLLVRALELKATLPAGYETLLCVGNYATETENNAFFTERKRFVYLNSLYTMQYSLFGPIVLSPLPAPLLGSDWKMESAEEELEYLQADEEIWPESPIGLDRLRTCKRQPMWKAFAAREGVTIAGSVMTWLDGTTGIIEDVFVRERWRKRGVAKHLLSTALVYLKEIGADQAVLTVFSDNESAISLYESVGFRKGNEEVRFSIPLP